MAALTALAADPDRVVVLEAVNSAFLPTFLIANLLTGGVNAAVDTLTTPPLAATAILAAYVALVAAIDVDLLALKEVRALA